MRALRTADDGTLQVRHVQERHLCTSARKIFKAINMIHCNSVKENTSLQIVFESVEGVSAEYKNRGDTVRKVY